jgi:hypothetical protein
MVAPLGGRLRADSSGSPNAPIRRRVFPRSTLRPWRAPCSAAASRKPFAYLPLCDMRDLQRREFHEALLDADTFEDLPGKWEAVILEAEQNRPNLRVVGGS